MQDCYVGDLGDFVKYGLLRFLTANFKLGVIWYYVRLDAQNKIRSQDGRRIRYLNLSSEALKEYDLKPYTEKERTENRKRLYENVLVSIWPFYILQINPRWGSTFFLF